MPDIHLLRPDGVAYCGIRRWCLKLHYEGLTVPDEPGAKPTCTRCQAAKRSAERWERGRAARVETVTTETRTEGHVVYPRFGDGGPERLPAPGGQIKDPRSIFHGFYRGHTCGCGKSAVVKEHGVWRCVPCARAWRKAAAEAGHPIY